MEYITEYIKSAGQIDSNICARLLRIRELELENENMRLHMKLNKPHITNHNEPSAPATEHHADTNISVPMTNDVSKAPVEPNDPPIPIITSINDRKQVAIDWIKRNKPQKIENYPIIYSETTLEYYNRYESEHEQPLSIKEFNLIVRDILGYAPRYAWRNTRHECVNIW